MEKEDKKTRIFVEKCKVCGKKIEGVTERQLLHRMKFHMAMSKCGEV